jgi:hypothetical protein
MMAHRLVGWRAIGLCCSVSNNTAEIRATIDTEGTAVVGCRIRRGGADGLMLSLVDAAASLFARVVKATKRAIDHRPSGWRVPCTTSGIE